MKRNRDGYGAMSELLSKKLNMEEERQEKKLDFKREELHLRHKNQEVEQELRREELRLRKEELSLQAKRDEAASKERQFVLSFILKEKK